MKKKSLFTIALAGWVLMGCSSDEMKDGQEGQQTPITFVSNVSTMRSANVNLQKTQLAEGVKVGVFVRDADGFISGGNNAQLTASGAGGFTGSPIYFPEDGASVNVLAYAPYQSGWSDQVDVAATFTVAANQSTDAGYLASDLLHGVPTATTNSFTKETPVVALNFQHKLSKLSVKFKTSEDTDVDLKGATINIVNTLPSATLKVSDGTLGAATGTATAIKAVTFASDATEFLASAVIVPQKVAAGSFIQVVLTNGKMLNARLNTEATFASGKAYVYSVNISGQGAEAQAEIELNSTVTDWVEDTTELTGDVTEEDAPEPEETKLYATFGTPASNATYTAPTYSWTAGNSNLMTVFEFSNGELKNYKTLKFTISNLSEGASVRMGYYVGNEWTEFGNGFYSAGAKEVDLTALGIDLSTVTKISFGGKSGSGGSVDIVATDVYLVGNDGGSGEEVTPTDGNTLTATFGTPGGNASYTAPTYAWTGSSNNLMTCFEFANGELANYKTLKFTFSNISEGAAVRMGYYIGSDWTAFNNGGGYYSNGTKEVDLTTLGIDLSTVTKICFGGFSSSGSVDIKASDVILSKE